MQRQRRIKCDETKPACIKCTSARFTCPGYKPPTLLRERPPRQLVPLKPVLTPQDGLVGAFFCTESVYSICPGFHIRPLLQSLMQYPALWHASLAIGGMHKRSQLIARSGPGDRDLASRLRMFSLAQYTRSVQLVLQITTEGGNCSRSIGSSYSTQEMVLMASILYGVIGAIDGNFVDARMHALSSIRMFNQWEFWQRRDSRGAIPARMIVGHLLNLERNPTLQTSSAESKAVARVDDGFVSMARTPFATADETCWEFDLLSESLDASLREAEGSSSAIRTKRDSLPDVGRRAHQLWQKKLVTEWRGVHLVE